MNNLEYLDYEFVNDTIQEYWANVFNSNKGNLMIDKDGHVYKLLPPIGDSRSGIYYTLHESSMRWFWWDGNFGTTNNFQYFGKLFDSFEPNLVWIPDPLTFKILHTYPYHTEPNLKTISYLLSLLQK